MRVLRFYNWNYERGIDVPRECCNPPAGDTEVIFWWKCSDRQVGISLLHLAASQSSRDISQSWGQPGLESILEWCRTGSATLRPGNISKVKISVPCRETDSAPPPGLVWERKDCARRLHSRRGRQQVSRLCWENWRSPLETQYFNQNFGPNPPFLSIC